MLPKKVRIGPFVFKVKYRPGLMDDGEKVGLTDYERQEILIQPGLTEQYERSVFLHELLHAASVDATAFALREDQVQHLTQMLMTALSDPRVAGVFLGGQIRRVREKRVKSK